MAGERLYTGQADPNQTEATTNNALGQIFTVSDSGRSAIGGGVWVESGVFRPWWSIWNRDTSTLLREGDITALGPSGTGWFYFNLADCTAGTTALTPLALSTGVNYQVVAWTSTTSGNQRYSDGGFSYPFGTSPLSTSGCVYGNNGDARSVFANNTGFTAGRFYTDVTLDSPSVFIPKRAIVGPSRAAQSRSRW